ncbi:MAG TPA: MBOAT family protein, partial [Candidatus Choladousia intestinipullorum]|nr:MBOAT family protein [Candidatus Choladousia intestinipullorum]
MIFSTYEFIFLYLPVTFFVYFLLNRFRYYSISKIWLALASFYFYAQGSTDFFPFFLGSVVGNYVVGSCLARLDGEQQHQKKLLLFLGVMGNVGLLGYYKYTDFFIENYNLLTG